ncbi:hypothetical protein AQPW35_24700 [Rubrivivax pictus]|uniref:Cyclic nucleotide-binding domain-containing protein n=1 Tax=Pseudaquabacterium pictum TaxID=2315236 RepID=A0A480AP27_9BURK|nr:hypothetical protein AQPW35_24700 [Rubrivivax pictus]
MLPVQVAAPRPAAPATTRPSVTVEMLRGVPLFHDLEPELLALLARRAVLRRLGRHAMVVDQASQEAGLFVLLQGQAQVLRHNLRGRSLLVDQLRSGDHFGELSAIDAQPQYAAVRCTLPSEVLVIGRDDFLDCLQESQALMQALLRLTVQRLRRKNRRIALLALHDVRGCVVQQLLDLAELRDGRPVVRGRVCRQAIADMIGASRAMVSRVMMALTRAGELQVLDDGSTVVHCQAPNPAARPPRGTAARRRAAG